MILGELAVEPGARATLVLFATAFCRPCAAARQVLRRVADTTDGVAFVDVDAEAHLGVVRALGIEGTPTTLVLDAAGSEVLRATGVPRVAAVRAVLT